MVKLKGSKVKRLGLGMGMGKKGSDEEKTRRGKNARENRGNIFFSLRFFFPVSFLFHP
jgi:hypothetical protein